MNRILLFIFGMVVASACTIESEPDDSSSGDDDGDECRAENQSLSTECQDCARAFCCGELESCETGSECARCSDSGETDCTVEGLRSLSALDECFVGSPCGILCYGCTPTTGPTGCGEVVRAWCEEIASCCAQDGCQETWGYDVEACIGFYAENSYACEESPYRYTRWMCQNVVDDCVDEVRLLTPSCTDLIGGTATWGSRCAEFWAQY